MSRPSLDQFQYEIGARIGRGDLAGAAAAAAACRAAWPDHPAGWLLGSVAALLADEKSTALALAEAGLVGHPQDAGCQLQKAECLLALGERARSLAAAAGAADSAPRDAAVLGAVGQFMIHAAAHQAALEVYNRAVAQSPADPTLFVTRAAVHRVLGHFDRAVADLERALALAPNDPTALKGLVELQSQSVDRNSLAAMEAALAVAPPGSKDAVSLWFGLAKSYEDIGDFAGSWRHLAAGNAAERARNGYQPKIDRLFIDRLIAGFPEAERLHPAPAPDPGRPIFIIGLPRTGTTLVERILASHSAVHPAGELLALSEAISAAVDRTFERRPRTWLEYAALLPSLEGTVLAGEYRARARSHAGDLSRFTDKQPTNFFYCPLIQRAFPQTPIVHLTRHPMAACYALFKTHFDGTYPFSYGLEDLADFYIGYRRLMSHWHQILPGLILDVAYEDVVTRQESTTRRLLERLDLPFEPACLDFHLNPAAVATASSVQVRQPLYDTSLEQWRHYATELAPLRDRLEAAGIATD